MQTLPIRLQPGADLRAAFEQLGSADAGFVVSAIGSLDGAMLRFAAESCAARLAGPMEIISLAGSITPDGAHLHMSVSDREGRVWGGHVAHGNIVRTTVEALIVVLPGWSLGRALDPATGYPELVVRGLKGA